MIFFRRLYSFWCCFWFLVLFIMLLPFFGLFLQKKSWHPAAHFLNRLWGQLFFPICGLSVRTDYRFRPEARKSYVFCANHSSYLDIALMGVVVPNYFAFVGKSSLQRIPFFGYMFRKLHISVDRSSKLSSYQTMQRALQTLDEGRSIMIFPEGGIFTTNPPFMNQPLKDGAFRMAIEKGVPLVPVTLPDNWQVLPDSKRLLFRRLPIRAVVHPPLSTEGLNLDDTQALSDLFYQTVTAELEKQLSLNRGQLSLTNT